MAKESVAAELARALDAEPLFHMSLGSKELFHSNFIAWFARKYADEAWPFWGRGPELQAQATSIESAVRRGTSTWLSSYLDITL